MNIYQHKNGFTYTEEELKGYAGEEGKSLEEYIKSKPLTIKGGKAQGSTVDPTMSQSDMGSQSL